MVLVNHLHPFFLVFFKVRPHRIELWLSKQDIKSLATSQKEGLFQYNREFSLKNRA